MFKKLNGNIPKPNQGLESGLLFWAGLCVI